MEFKTTMFLPNSTVTTGQLCPDQRRMPQIGSLFAEAIAMVLLAVRLPVVVVVASPVIVQLLTGPCYLDSLCHSLLMNCGSEIFSLEDFFASAYACNQYFWDILAILGNFLAPGFAQTFLNGMTAVGQNSGVSSFMPGIINAFSKITANDPTEGVTKAQDMMSGGMTRFGPMSIFMKTALNPIAGAHWIWRMGSSIVVQIIQAVQGQRSIASVFWNVLYDGRVDYNDLVASRMLNTCGGFALMAGYTNPLGNVILHYCSAGVKSTIATLDLMSIFFVDLPLIVCVCRQTSGNNPSDWILNNCNSPDGLKPLLRTIIDDPNSCVSLVNQTNSNLTAVFDDTFGELFAGTTSVGSVLDSLLGAVDGNKAGQCDNFDSNPYVVTLIPEPADYWRVCGNTDFCKLLCQQQIQAFTSVQPSTVRSSTTSQTVQSLFFPTLNADAYNPFTSMGVVALNELDSCTTLCSEADDRCFLASGFVGTDGTLRVAQYCVPSALGQGVSKTGQWDTLGISGQAVSIVFIRINIQGGWQDQYALVGMQAQSVQVCTQLTCSEYNPTYVDVGGLSFLQMQAMDDVVVFQLSTASMGTLSYCLKFQSVPGSTGEWTFNPCSNTNVWDQSLYYIVLNAQSQAFLLPYDDLPMQLCNVDSSGVALVQCTQYNGFNKQNVPVKTNGGMQSRVSQYTSGSGVFIASNDASQWLTMLFITTTGGYASASVGNSMPVSMQYTLQQGCSLDMCTGCTQLSVQRLCFAAQECQLARCVGSQVNQIRPLCAIGGVVESQYFAMLATIQGIWSMIAGTLVLILDASGGINPPSTISWPDEVFYGLVCSLKDSIASEVSILTAAINGVIQSSMPVTMMAHGDTVDNSFLASFTLTMMSITNFLFQLCLAPLYAAIAAQKVMVCQANSLIAAVSGNNAITIGDPGIQSASSAASGTCMSQTFSENAQSLNNGVNTAQTFTTGSTQVLSQIAGLALTLPLDALVHPIDVTFTYMLGVVTGLQDVLETADQTKCANPSPHALYLPLHSHPRSPHPHTAKASRHRASSTLARHIRRARSHAAAGHAQRCDCRWRRTAR